MQVVSLQTGLIKTYSWNGRNIHSAIFKTPVEGEIFLGRFGLTGDRQAERKHHGGIDKAVYSYAVEYYNFWKNKIPEIEFQPGIFGENLLIRGYKDHEISPGDIFQCGNAILQAVGPRIPCFKLNIRFGRMDMTETFTSAAKYGVYYRVLQEGHVSSGADFIKTKKSNCKYTIEDMALAYSAPFKYTESLKLILNHLSPEDDLQKTYGKLWRRVERKQKENI